VGDLGVGEGSEECVRYHLVMKQGKTSIKRKTLLVWILGGFFLFVCFSAIVSVRVINSNFVFLQLGHGWFFATQMKKTGIIFFTEQFQICIALVWYIC